MKRLMECLIVAGASLMATTAHSEISADKYELRKKMAPADTERYLVGVGVGYSWANTHLSFTGQNELYCQPDKLALQGMNYIRIMEDQIKLGLHKPDTPVELLMLDGLRRVFPCPWDKYKK